jgi:aminobenzoyl-glutamate transport protein
MSLAITATAPKTVMQRFLDGIEKVGNMVPHPVVIFLALIGIVIVLSVILSVFGTAVTLERINPDTHAIETTTTSLRSLLDGDGIRFIYSSLIPNFMSFTAVGLMIGAMIGAGVAEESGLVNSLIRKLVLVSPTWALTYILRRTPAISCCCRWRGSPTPVSDATRLRGSRSASPPSPEHSRSTC